MVLFNINFKHTNMETMDLVPEQVSNGIRSRAAKQELKTKDGIKTKRRNKGASPEMHNRTLRLLAN
jgi:hypothetical protein